MGTDYKKPNSFSLALGRKAPSHGVQGGIEIDPAIGEGLFLADAGANGPSVSSQVSPHHGEPLTLVMAAQTTYYVYGFDGKLLAEYDQAGNCVKDYLYIGSKLVAEYQPASGKYYYYMSDQVNSTRMVTDDTGVVVHSTTYDPYGGPQKTWIKTYEPKLKFSGKEREIASELDYFGARYYDHIGYRFISSDPITKIEEAISSPQKWNLYSYCHNNPLSFFDPDGRSPRDVKKILETFWESVEKMIEENLRSGLPWRFSGWWSNISTSVRWLKGKPEKYLSCVGQADFVRNELNKNEYDDNWTFELESNMLGTHTWGRAKSSNPDDPEVIFDPWKGKAIIEFKGPNSGEKMKKFFESLKEEKTEFKETKDEK